MHAALRTTELRAIIFKQLPSSTLVALATSCKALSAAALEILWYELKDFKPLAMLLPNSKRGTEVDPGYILPKDVDRIRYYGPFVRRLAVPALPSHLSPSTLEQVIVALGDDDLFPLLRHLDYTGPSVYAPCLHRLVPHTLLSLAVTMADSHGLGAAHLERREITALAMPRTRNITEFLLELSATSTPWPVADIFAGWDSLQALSLTGQITKEVVDAAMRLPRLRALSLHRLLGELLPRPSWTLEKRTKLPLRNLHLQNLDLCAAKRFLDLLPTTTRVDMSQLHVVTYSLYGATDFSNFCRAVQSRCVTYALEDLVLEPDQDVLISPTYEARGPIVTLRDLQPLLTFERLCQCTIAVPRTLDIGDNDLRVIAQAWPQVRILCLRGILSSTTRCTLEGLVHLARYCKRLERLAITLRGNVIATPREKFGVVHHNLHHLDVLNSPILTGQEPRIAPFLGTVFPSISRISSTAGPTSYVHAWGQVMAIYRSFVDFAPLAP
ncbi:uncharacterized protein SCHCODRAFT_02687081 [Schizophyllum commune H4-8]|nr:uncharacterized protein SCHCODRAFT_02687081 [Schizophyllum commune H4-8]KAI5895768.1 hypothetical protein SCHCODRAFT_02687081 [Schizophyllum commune H4-8]